MQRVVVISGGSSGIGKALVERYLAAGDQIFELSRSGSSRPGVTHISVDVCDEEQIRLAMEQIGQAAGRIDLLLNNAGMGISGALEMTDSAEARRLMDVDFFGVFLCCKYALPWLRESKDGRIINTSSVAAVYSIPYQSFYSAAKAAVNSLSLALANELRPFRIQVAAFMPGDVRSGFTAARRKDERGDELYGERIRKAVASMEKDEQNGMSPEAIAKAIYRLSTRRRMKPLKSCGLQYQALLFLGRLLPSSFINYVLGKMY